MSVEVTEDVSGNVGTRDLSFDIQSGKATISRSYLITGTANDAEQTALNALLAEAPNEVEAGLYFGYFKNCRLSYAGNNTWKATATWEVPEFRPNDGEDAADSIAFSVDTTGATAHVNESLEVTDHQWASGVTNIDRKKTIGEDSSGNVAGCEKVVPNGRYSFTKILKMSDYSPATAIAHQDKTGKVNSSTTTIYVTATQGFSFAAGCLLFIGMRTNYQPTSKTVEIYYEFQYSANATGLSVGSVTVDKKGHEYLDIHFIEKEDPTSKKTVKEFSDAMVHRVYETTDLNGLVGV